MLDYNGSTVEVTKHVTELTVRHGQLADLAIITGGQTLEVAGI